MKKPRYNPKQHYTKSSDGTIRKHITFWDTDTKFKPSKRKKSDFTKDGTLRSKNYLGLNND